MTFCYCVDQITINGFLYMLLYNVWIVYKDGNILMIQPAFLNYMILCDYFAINKKYFLSRFLFYFHLFFTCHNMFSHIFLDCITDSILFHQFLDSNITHT